MRKCLFVIFFFNFILLSANLFGVEKDDFHFILGFKIPAHAILKKDSPHIPLPEDNVDSGIGIGFYAEFIPFRYITIESGFYVRTFTLGDDEGNDIITYNEMQVLAVGKIRFPISDNFAITLGGGFTYCNPFSGKIYLTLGEDGDPLDIPEPDLISDFGLIARLGFQIRIRSVFINIDLGVEHVEKVIKIEQTDLVFAIGLGFGLF